MPKGIAIPKSSPTIVPRPPPIISHCHQAISYLLQVLSPKCSGDEVAKTSGIRGLGPGAVMLREKAQCRGPDILHLGVGGIQVAGGHKATNIGDDYGGNNTQNGDHYQ